jgi:hypothetical protein
MFHAARRGSKKTTSALPNAFNSSVAFAFKYRASFFHLSASLLRPVPKITVYKLQNITIDSAECSEPILVQQKMDCAKCAIH